MDSPISRSLEVLVEEVVKCPAAELVLPSPAEPSPPPSVFARPAAPAQPEALCTSQPIALPGGGLRPGLRSKEIKGLPVASFRVVRPRDGEPCDSDASEELDDAAFEHRHQRLASIERKGFSVMGRKREPVLTLAAASSAPAPSGDEREIRRSVQMLLGRPPPTCCPACPPYFKHVAHTCDKAKASAAAAEVQPQPACASCPACPPRYRHVAHTCGKTYVGKRYGKRRKKKAAADTSAERASAAAHAAETAGEEHALASSSFSSSSASREAADVDDLARGEAEGSSPDAP